MSFTAHFRMNANEKDKVWLYLVDPCRGTEQDSYDAETGAKVKEQWNHSCKARKAFGVKNLVQ